MKKRARLSHIARDPVTAGIVSALDLTVAASAVGCEILIQDLGEKWDV